MPHLHTQLINRLPCDMELLSGELCGELAPKDAPLNQGRISSSICRGAARGRLVRKLIPQCTGWRISRLVMVMG